MNNRDLEIYRQVIQDELPITLVANLHGLSRQGAHNIINRMMAEYGGQKPVYDVTIGPVEVPDDVKAMLETESARLGIPQSSLIRIAINQAMQNGLEPIELGEYEIGGTTPMMKISQRQNIFISTQITNKTRTILQILKSYQPIYPEMKNE